MGDLTDSAIEAATRRGEIDLLTKPRGRSVAYDRSTDRVIVELTNGTTFAFPPGLLQGLDGARPEQIAEVELQGMGFGLHWKTLDADFTLEGLMAGRFGTARYMRERFGPGWDAVAA